MKKLTLGAILALAIGQTNAASAAINLVDKEGWKLDFYGFVESDINYDTTRSFGEFMGGGAVAKGGTAAGDNSRMQFSGRNTRFGFNMVAPEEYGWKTGAVLEYDLFGYDPAAGGGSATVGAVSPANTEGSFYTSPTLRVRHAYATLESGNFEILTGQAWSLFGWQPYYFPVDVSIAPEPGELFQRNLQTTFMDTWAVGGTNKLTGAISIVRPTQRDGTQPDLDLGVRWFMDGWTSAFAGATGEVSTTPLSVALSSRISKFENPTSTTNTTSTNTITTTSYAIDAMVPLIPGTAADPGNSLTFQAEWVTGQGIGGYPNWNGGVGTLPSGTGLANATNLDAGLGGYDSNGNFQVVNVQSSNFSLQYQLPAAWTTFVNAGYGQINSNNVGTLGGTYDNTHIMFLNVLHDFTKHFRLGLEANNNVTHYVADGATPNNTRYQVDMTYRF